jgi:hypothetical protein
MHTVSLINAIMLTAELNASDNIYKDPARAGITWLVT